MVDTTVTRPSSLLQPSWLPFYPGDIGIPPLPPPISPGSVLLPTVQGSWRGRPSTPKNPNSANRLYSSPKKSAKMDTGEVKPKPREDSPDETHDFEFEDLKAQLIKEGEKFVYGFTAAEECVIRAVGPHYDLSCPQPQLDPTEYGHRVLPATILYDAWQRQHESEFVFSSSEDEQEEDEGEGDSKADVVPN